MKRKNIPIFTASLMLSVSAINAQVALELPSNYLSNNTKGGINTLPENIQGNAYLPAEFTNGMVKVGDERPYPALLRYNMYADEIEVNTGNGTSALFKREYVQATINGQRFVIHSYEKEGGTALGYFEVLNDGDSQLLKRHESRYIPEQPAASSYARDIPAQFKTTVTYFLKSKGQPAQEVKLRKKDILEALVENDKAGQYAKSNKLDLKSEKDVVTLLNYCNAL